MKPPPVPPACAALATYDFNRDGRLNAADVLLVRNNQRHRPRPPHPWRPRPIRAPSPPRPCGEPPAFLREPDNGYCFCFFRPAKA